MKTQTNLDNPLHPLHRDHIAATSTPESDEYPDPFTDEDRQRWHEQEQASMETARLEIAIAEEEESVSQMMRAEIQQ